MLTLTEPHLTVSPIGETRHRTALEVVGRIGIELDGRHRDVALVDETLRHPNVTLPFTTAWLFPAPTYLCWQRASRAFGFDMRTGYVRLNGHAVVYGCWLLNLTPEQAAAAGTLAGQADLLEWTADAVTFHPAATGQPAVSFGWFA